MGERVRTDSKAPDTKKREVFHRRPQPADALQFSPSSDNLHYLHRALGNQAVERLFRSGYLQAKLRVSRPDDLYEQEADRIADQVMRLPEPSLQPRPT